MSFFSAATTAYKEIESRRRAKDNALRFGIKYLDDATKGIFKNDLILLGAPAGVGKTQFCCNLAYANIRDGKRVHYFALEAEEFEIEKRIKFQMFCEAYYSQRTFSGPKRRITFDRWYLGEYLEETAGLETQVADEFAEKYKNLFLFYKSEDFGVDDLTLNVLRVASETDLIIVDHAHYFDYDDDNENRAMKAIAKAARTLALEKSKPIILVAHLRKRDKNNKQLVADMEEFHGSSDLFKIATKVITFSPGEKIEGENKYITYFRVPKNRMNGSVTRFIGQLAFNIEGGFYEDKYKLGLARAERFEELSEQHSPDWATRFERTGSDYYALRFGQ